MLVLGFFLPYVVDRQEIIGAEPRQLRVEQNLVQQKQIRLQNYILRIKPSHRLRSTHLWESEIEN